MSFSFSFSEIPYTDGICTMENLIANAVRNDSGKQSEHGAHGSFPENMMKRKVDARRLEGNFTLIEFINVIEIIAVLSAMLIPVLKQTGSKAYQADCTDCLRRIPDSCIGLDSQGVERLHPVRTSVFPCSYTRLTSDEIGDPGRSIPFFDGILSFNGASGCGASFHGTSPDAAGKADPPYPGSVSNSL